MLKEFILKNRSYRRFYEEVKIELDTLKDLVDLARLSASAANLQPLKYIISSNSQTNSLIFKSLAWAGYLKDWKGPEEGERPTGYIIMMGDKEISKSIDCDHGIAVQSILLGAVEQGLGGCMFASIKREQLRKDFNIPEKYEILLVVALGKPKEKVVIEEVKEGGDIKYWRDENKIHRVPKRSLQDIIIGEHGR